jgi:hypothetical protein
MQDMKRYRNDTWMNASKPGLIPDPNWIKCSGEEGFIRLTQFSHNLFKSMWTPPGFSYPADFFQAFMVAATSNGNTLENLPVGAFEWGMNLFAKIKDWTAARLVGDALKRLKGKDKKTAMAIFSAW